MKRHTVDLSELVGYEPSSMLASAASNAGHKRLTLFVQPFTKAVRFEVDHREGDVSQHETIEAAVAAYNAIPC